MIDPKFSLSSDMKICLFISSFAYVNIPQECSSEDWGSFKRVSIESQSEIIKWFRSLLNSRKDVYIIYRPHPAELNSRLLYEIEKNESNFKIISDFSVKQWILIADVIYNWYSTSMMEIACANRACFLLRPIALDYMDDIDIFIGAKTIKTYEDFKASLDKRPQFPVDENVLRDYYQIDDVPAYIKTANELEKIYSSNEYMLPKTFCNLQKRTIKDIVLATRIGRKYNQLLMRKSARKGSVDAANALKYEMYVEQKKKSNYASKREIIMMMKKCYYNKSFREGLILDCTN